MNKTTESDSFYDDLEQMSISDLLININKEDKTIAHFVEEQGAYNYLDSEPQTLTAKAHRPAYGKDGDYFSKPSEEDIFEKVYAIMHEANPTKFPSIY